MRLQKLSWSLAEDLSRDQSNHAGRLAAYIYKMLRRAINLVQRLPLPLGGRFLQVLKQTWRPNDGQFRFAVPVELHYPNLPVIAAITANGQNPHVKIFQKPGSQQRYAVVLIDVKDLEEAKNYKEIGAAVQEILYHIVHEPVHVHNYPTRAFEPTASGSEGKPLEGLRILDAKKALERGRDNKVGRAELAKLRRQYDLQLALYYASPWEVEAYGRQFAMFYHRRHPHAAFNMQQFLADYQKWVQRNHSAKSVNRAVDQYFGKFMRPVYQNYKDKSGRRPFREAVLYLQRIIFSEVDRLLGTNRGTN